MASHHPPCVAEKSLFRHKRHERDWGEGASRYLHTLAIALIAVAATLAPSAAIAQTPPPGAAADTEAAVPPEAPKKPLTRKEARALQEKADARRCLEFPTPLMIIKCADKYRLNKRET
jgi:hypothetical protein